MALAGEQEWLVDIKWLKCFNVLKWTLNVRQTLLLCLLQGQRPGQLRVCSSKAAILQLFDSRSGTQLATHKIKRTKKVNEKTTFFATNQPTD